MSREDRNSVPKHVAIIMDGNGRWAQQRGLPRTMGHRAGADALKRIVRHCDHLGISYLTVYAFSTENWRRPEMEVGFLMSLLKEYILKELAEAHAKQARIKVLGDLARLPASAREAIEDACLTTKNNQGLVVNLALNYGGRAEIVQAVRQIAAEAIAGRISADSLDEETFAGYLYTKDCPDPEVVIRTSGELRLSNFLLWQAAYSEIIVVDELWPDFNEQSLERALEEYRKRDRRFGGLGKGNALKT